MARRPTAPPFKVGEKVRYNSVEFGRERAERWLRRGEIGVVVKVHPAQGATGILLDLGDGESMRDDGMDGWSTVRYLDDPGFDRAATADAVRRGEFERVR